MAVLKIYLRIFIAMGVGFYGILINIGALFVILKPRIGFFDSFYFNQDNVF